MTLSSKPIQVFKKMWKLSWTKNDPQSYQALDGHDGSDDSASNSAAPADHNQHPLPQAIAQPGTTDNDGPIYVGVAGGGQGGGGQPVMISSAPQARTWSGGNGASAYTPTSPLSSSQHSMLRPFIKTGPSSFNSVSASSTTNSALFLQPCPAPPRPCNTSLGRGTMKRKDSFVSTISRSIDTAASAVGSSSVISVDGKIDFLSCLPYEIAMVIVIYADFPTVTTIAQVSRSWRRFAHDNAVWRRLFLQQQEWRTPRALASAGYHRHNHRNHRHVGAGSQATGLRRLHSGHFGAPSAPALVETSDSSGIASPSACSTNGMNTPRIGDDSSFSSAAAGGGSTHPLMSAYVGSSLRPALTLQHMVAPSPTPSMINGLPGGCGGRLRGADWRYLFQQRLELDRHWEKGIADMHVVTGHADSVYCVQCDHDKIVTGSRDRTIRVWDSQSFDCLRTLTGHDASVLCLKYDDTAMVTGSSDATVIIWDWETGTPKLRLVSHSAGVLDVAFDSEYVVSCSKDCTIKVWQRSTGKLIRTMVGHRGPVNAVQLRGNRIVSASGDSLIKMWDIKTGELIRTFAGHTRGLACVQFDGKTIVSGSSDQLIKVWEADTGKCTQTLRGHKDLVRTLHFTGGRRAVSGSYDQSIKVWDIATGKCTLDLKDMHTSWVFDVQFSASRIVSTSQDQKIIVWDFSKDLDVSEID
ncbi:hypothetical protein IW140_004097 [Coemansia sp. RSA 1813]|nr:hypothetical protein EV178_004115 [Coemansia sp. RSA 1646]KAJ1764612.1 hypothetical protein LPJ74_006610 [Coemansia sp. RSA 1843]KAJ2088337.1 hypothetical protein IW138_004314 [Coemansia sp. RSA 986]KAJ2213325.1 hypothetical protein EV179_003923 [Coemansia sp. RSA 487]KAJ2568191.1 hypothetical protein IW140_004097 [Coemansia sp. RSA 1813]